MTNGFLSIEAAPYSNGSLSNPIGKTVKAGHTGPTTQPDRATGKRVRGRLIQRSLLGGLLDPKSSSLSLTALARAAAFSGKRLVLEIRDETPVRIVRTSTKGM